ncbi:hypothetical protein J27TS7_53970 [Paenibacillus dendritiformis]|nr:hypothetical protein J27TS7_53970 [Paenibacillus dendritiformis]
MQLESPRLLIRDLQREDWMDVNAYASNPEVTKYMIWGPNSEADTKAYMEEQMAQQHAAERSHYEFGVVLKATNHSWVVAAFIRKDATLKSGIAFTLIFTGMDMRQKRLKPCSGLDLKPSMYIEFMPPVVPII